MTASPTEAEPAREMVEAVAKAIARSRAIRMLEGIGSDESHLAGFTVDGIDRDDARAAIPIVIEAAAARALSIYCEDDWMDRDQAANVIAAAIRQLDPTFLHAPSLPRTDES